jgi:hypothetical protein
MGGLLDEASKAFRREFDEKVAELKWVGHVLQGEFNENRSQSEVIADLVVNLAPGFNVVFSIRDVIAVGMRIGRRELNPNEKHQTTLLVDWILLIACSLPLLFLTAGAVVGAIDGAVVGTAVEPGGATLAGGLFGGAIGGLTGEESGAFIRAVLVLMARKVLQEAMSAGAASKDLADILAKAPAQLRRIVKGDLKGLLSKAHFVD